MRALQSIRLFVVIAVAFVSCAALPAQTAPNRTYFKITNSSGVVLNVLATDMTAVDSQGIIELSDCTQIDKPIVAVFPQNSGLTATQAGLSPACPASPIHPAPDLNPHPWLLLYSGHSFARVVAGPVDALNLHNSLLFYNSRLQANALLTMPLTAPPPVPPLSPIGLPIVTVREDHYCTATLDCGAPPSSGTGPVGALSAASSSAATQQQQQQSGAVAGTCSTAPAYAYPVLSGRKLSFGRKQYHAVLPLWPPIDNEYECSVRQLVFNVPNDLKGGLAIQGDNSMRVSLRIFPNKKQPADAPTTMPEMKVYGISRLVNGGYTLLSFDAQAHDQNFGGLQVNGNYCVEITITGKRQPLTSYTTGQTIPGPLPAPGSNPTDCQ